MRTLLLILLLVPMMSFGQNVYIPDANFKGILVNNTAINTNGDSEIQVSEASAFTGPFNCSDSNISDLTGIEAFTALTELYCSFNQLTSLDVSNNTALTELYCCCAGLTSLDVSSNTALRLLIADDNELTSLDVSSNTALEYLSCYRNELTSLDVSNNTALRTLYCHRNNLTSLDVSNNTALTSISCFQNELECLNVKNGNNTAFFEDISFLPNPNLTCIEVDDVEWSTSNWADCLDSQTSFSENCNNACSNSTNGINELTTTKNLIQILDMLGIETPFKPNIPLLYIYDDGTVERKVVLK
ncbi:MAG: Leucine-rich repeat (LRR) protein [Saprospiraceae bacterium]|jgi:Leucine-rich repeat (LRR) protein